MSFAFGLHADSADLPLTSTLAMGPNRQPLRSAAKRGLGPWRRLAPFSAPCLSAENGASGG